MLHGMQGVYSKMLGIKRFISDVYSFILRLEFNWPQSVGFIYKENRPSRVYSRICVHYYNCKIQVNVEGERPPGRNLLHALVHAHVPSGAENISPFLKIHFADFLDVTRNNLNLNSEFLNSVFLFYFSQAQAEPCSF